MAEINAFSVDGERYLFTSADQVYVGETGLGQLELDYGCTPDELLGALADAGGGVAIIDGRSVEGDGWDVDGIANGGYCTLVMTVLHSARATLEAHGKENIYGEYVRHPAGSDSASFDGTDWTVLVYGEGDVLDIGHGTYAGHSGSTSTAYCWVPVPLAPGVSSASCASVDTIQVFSTSGSSSNATSTSKVSVEAFETGEAGGVMLEVSGLSLPTANAAVTASFTDVSLKFS